MLNIWVIVFALHSPSFYSFVRLPCILTGFRFAVLILLLVLVSDENSSADDVDVAQHTETQRLMLDLLSGCKV